MIIEFEDGKQEFRFLVKLAWNLNIVLDRMKDKNKQRSKKYRDLKKYIRKIEDRMVLYYELTKEIGDENLGGKTR